jgi:hypothetical protein
MCVHVGGDYNEVEKMVIFVVKLFAYQTVMSVLPIPQFWWGASGV